MRDIHTEIEIDASAQTVWDILTDLESYHLWNPFVREAHGQAIVGQRLTCRPEVMPGRLQTFHPIVTRITRERIFEWTGTVIFSWLAAGRHMFEIQTINDNRVRLLHRQEFYGLLAPIAGSGRLCARTRDGFVRMNEALKERAEVMAQGQPS